MWRRAFIAGLSTASALPVGAPAFNDRALPDDIVRFFSRICRRAEWGEKVMVGKSALMLCVAAAGLAQPALAEEEIRFAPKAFFNDVGDNVEVSGTLTGPGVGYPNNTNVVTCVKERKECFVITVEADKNYVSRVTGPGIMPVTLWTNAEIVAQDESTCSRTTISIERKGGDKRMR